MNRKTTLNLGLSLIELLIYFLILSIIFSLGVISFRSFQLESEISNGVRIVIAALNTARYTAVAEYEKIKVCQNNNDIFLQKKIEGDWITYKKFKVKGELILKFNNSPVFSPLGSVAPLCSIFVKNEYKGYKSSISMSGRIKTTQITL